MIAAIGLLIILNFLSFGLLFILFVRIRDLSNNQQGLADRVGVIEEMMVELAEAEEMAEGPSITEINQKPVSTTDEQPEIVTAEQERTRQVLELARSGLTPEAIAKTSGYSNGEVRLILNLHQSGRSIR